MTWRNAMLIVGVGCAAALVGEPQGGGVPSEKEQSEFAMEGVPIAKPADVPSDLVELLRKTKFVLGCLEGNQSAQEITGDWFVASKIHLNGTQEFDLVVMPRELRESPSRNRCLYGANTQVFWIFRPRAGGYDLFLEINVLQLRVLDSRTNGYRDIQTTSATLNSRTTLIFKFDGHRYHLYKKTVLEL